jgi:hypothetical protein
MPRHHLSHPNNGHWHNHKPQQYLFCSSQHLGIQIAESSAQSVNSPLCGAISLGPVTLWLWLMAIGAYFFSLTTLHPHQAQIVEAVPTAAHASASCTSPLGSWQVQVRSICQGPKPCCQFSALSRHSAAPDAYCWTELVDHLPSHLGLCNKEHSNGPLPEPTCFSQQLCFFLFLWPTWTFCNHRRASSSARPQQ